jgi:amino acid adenylation domain-containing protein
VLFDRSLTQSLKDLSQAEGVTLFMTLLAAFVVLLHRYCGQDDIVVGAPTAGRNRSQLEHLIGFFVNSIVLRTDLSGDPTFRQLLKRVRGVVLGALEHQDLPFEKLVEELQPERDLSRNPLFQVTFQLVSGQNGSASPGLPTDELEMNLPGVERGTSIFDIAFSVLEATAGLSGYLEYNVDLFEASTIQRLVDHFQILLEGLAADPDSPISRRPLLTRAERHRLLSEWNQTWAPAAAHACLHHWFEAQVQQTPDAVALIFNEEELTYAELNRRANQLAHGLRRRGLGPDRLAAVCLERSVELVVALLGVLKAGGAYVPVDPDYPPERVALMLEDAQACVQIRKGRPANTDGVPALTAPTIYLDADWRELQGESTANPDSGAMGENLAYVIYTSGSTGRPKGVMISHTAICNHMAWMQATFAFHAGSRVLQKTPISFDASIWEFYAPLLVGGRLVVAPPGVHQDPAALAGVIQKYRITTLQLVPSLLRALLDQPSFGECRTLEDVFCGGEVLTPALQDRFFDVLPAQLHNLYGPTEATIDALYWTCRRDVPLTNIPIGRPIHNVRAYVLDAHCQPVPVGVGGDLYLGGAGLARGYWRRPDLTAEKFVEIGFGEAGIRQGELPPAVPERQRLYNTGDQARYRHDGTIEFLGRRDHQVKLRGYRIELGEIEAALAGHPAIREAVVAVREDIPGDQRLVAYLVQSADPQPSGGLPAPEDWIDKRVSEWQVLYEDIYGRASESAETTFNIVGWTSSFTGEPLPAEEMREWLDQTVERVLALKPRRVLEIGCGTGLLLFRLAPLCEQYTATDFSSAALGYVQKNLKRLHLPEVQLLHQAAHEFAGLAAGALDLVIINSVIQYFPSSDYLLGVLEGALDRLVPGGSVFIGDVRSLPLLEAFHAAVELANAPASVPVSDLQARVRKRLTQEKELAVHPNFFRALPQRSPSLSRVQIELKRGRHQNEMTCFRYDVTLGVGPALGLVPQTFDLDWAAQVGTLERLRPLLDRGDWEVARVMGIPNRRVWAAIQTEAFLAGAEAPTAGEIRSRLADGEPAGVDPQAVWDLAREAGYQASLYPSASDPRGCFDALLSRVAPPEPAAAYAGARPAVAPLRTYTNAPMQALLAQSLVPELRRFLESRVPEYMIPSAFVLLDSLPLTANGKVNRGALPGLETTRPQLEEAYVAPRTEVEKTLADIWANALGLDLVGIHDNFFALGGHSLLATSVIARVRDALQVEVPLRRLFEVPTVAAFAEALALETVRPPLTHILPAAEVEPGQEEGMLGELESMSDESVDALLIKLLDEEGRA